MKVFGNFLFSLTLLISSMVQAHIVSGIHFTEGGKAVDLQGLEWLSLDRTRGISRSDIENGYGGLWEEGWRYANRLQTETLLQSLWGGDYKWGYPDYGDGADWFFRSLAHGPLLFYESVLRNFFYGAEGECSNDLMLGCQGYAKVAYSNVGLPPTGWFYNDQGLDATIANPVTVNSNLQDSHFGSLLIRVVAVPEPNVVAVAEPNAIYLFGIGLFALFGLKRLI